MTQKSDKTVVCIIGGTGLYQIEGFDDAQWVTVQSPFGEPSDQLLMGNLDGQAVAFLPRHGRGHRILPHTINYRANIDVLKRAGVDRIVSFSAVGSLDGRYTPGDFTLVDQYIDRTRGRVSTFFGNGFVAHVSMADPVCRTTSDAVARAANGAGINIINGATYVVIDGPQFSTRAESFLYKSWGCHIIGMTAMPEAKLAREAEIAYASVAMVTDYDCWHETHSDVTAADVIEVLHANSDTARNLVRAVIPAVGALQAPFASGAHTALRNAVATDVEHRDANTTRKLDAVAGRVLSGPGWQPGS